MTQFRKYTFLLLLQAFFLSLMAEQPVRAEQQVEFLPINLGIAGPDEFETGEIILPRVPVTWYSDNAWRISIALADQGASISSDGRYVELFDSLQWRIDEDDVWHPVDVNPVELAWGPETGSGVVYIDFRLPLDWLSTPPGEYTADVVFTIDQF